MTEIHMDQPLSHIHIGNALFNELKSRCKNKAIVLLCIGTDRCTGDSLGPLTGYNLNKNVYTRKNIHIHGTLDNPVHAKNLLETINTIHSKYESPFVIAVDACLGNKESIGKIKLSNSPLRPGAGVNKNLPTVGDISILGIVNLGGFMEIMTLQSTRLNLVLKMSEVISKGIEFGIWKFLKESSFNNLVDNQHIHIPYINSY
ncbi:putative sporulation protein YyaC [Alkalithermobacter thermoalcaliphilus JW-YL-7 = DSM 7308]|uniref:Sporulation protein YyaC n=1 Tax=Alkalithermobacter thermoalcaliphilus JW-YL-7 = DSM 7308 TaxID=1121328 RepID=A0A150FS43_CLOPD|nr:sporulation protein YyaC [[Clostridium] paradoxum JW-YL-7 = DSM 7308]SHK80289.1 putative sporulation protein YyaC [[Clostridium] paradoxum JW-YL-7 = DSM 7308]